MLDFISGTVHRIASHQVTILAGGLGLSFNVSKPETLRVGEKVELYTYMHWNAENGPSLFGFHNDLERSIFLMIIDCPKIGPKIALSILAQLGPSHFLEIIAAGNEKALSALNGIGEKKAEQIIIQLKHKVSKLLASGTVSTEDNSHLAHWHNIGEALISLGYSKQEVANAIRDMAQKTAGEIVSFDSLLRKTLAHLSGS